MFSDQILFKPISDFPSKKKPPPFVQGWTPLVILLLLPPSWVERPEDVTNNVKCDGKRVRNSEGCELLEDVVEGVEKKGGGVGF